MYAQPDTGLLVVLDHLEAEWTDAGRGAIRLRNPTRFPARARLLVETSVVARTRALGPASALGWPLLNLAAGEERVFSLELPA